MDFLVLMSMDISFKGGRVMENRISVVSIIVEDMEARGIVGPANGSKPREIIHIP